MLKRPLAYDIVALVLLLPAVARAQAPAAPSFDFGKRPDAGGTEWKAQAKGGLLVTGGSSRSRNGTFSLSGSRQSGADKVSVEGNLAYGRSDVLVPVIDPTGEVVGLARQGQTTADEWRARGRYDRFFTAHNSGYLLGQIGANRVAGKSLLGGGQVGYSRELYKSARHAAVAEVGYDLAHERYVQGGVEPTTIHSGRIFAGELLTLTPQTGVTASVEALFNLNREKALDANDSTGATKEVRSWHDTRITAKAGITTTLYKSLSFAFSFTLRYDQNPAPLPVPASAGGAKYAAGFQPFADRVDTLTEATLVFTFL